jgi:hypothetical protein
MWYHNIFSWTQIVVNPLFHMVWSVNWMSVEKNEEVAIIELLVKIRNNWMLHELNVWLSGQILLKNVEVTNAMKWETEK